MNKIEELFKEQIEEAIPFTENYIPTFEELNVLYGDEELAKKKISYLQDHLGDARLFYILEEYEGRKKKQRLSILWAWKSEIVNSLQNLEYVRHSTKFPIFVKTVDKEQ